jgi:hypothetical protein
MKSTATASEFSPSSIAAPQPLLANHLACQLWQISFNICGGVLPPFVVPRRARQALRVFDVVIIPAAGPCCWPVCCET